MNKADLMKIPSKEFGLPSEKKFPMQDEKHLRAAIAYFYTAKPDKRKELAKNIVRRHKELNSNVKISKKNPLFKFVPEEMKNLNESYLFENVNVEHFRTMFGSKGKEIVESLLTKTGLNDVDDIDSQIPDEFRSKQLLLGSIKSYILNELGENYPVIYTDYYLTKGHLEGNNGGINTLSETSILLDYRSFLNESSNIDVINDMSHIQFCALLREWDENYSKGHRNPTYDRLMIENWKSRVETLLAENHIQPDEKGTIKIKAIHGADVESRQKLIDLGLRDPKEYRDPHAVKDDVHDTSPIRKAAEIGFKIAQDIIDKHHDSSEDSDYVDGSLNLKLYTYNDNIYEPQKGHDVEFEDLWKL